MLDVPETKSTSTIAQIKHLQEEIARLSVQAKDDALRQAQQAVETLNALGFAYRLLDGAQKTQMPRKRSAAKPTACHICEFTTEPAHNARQHRSQGQDKRPFTDDELVQLNLRRTT